MRSKNKLGFYYITIFFSIIVNIFNNIIINPAHVLRSLIPNDRFSRRYIRTFIFFLFFLLFISLIEIVIRNRAKSIRRCDVSRGEMWRDVARCGAGRGSAHGGDRSGDGWRIGGDGGESRGERSNLHGR